MDNLKEIMEEISKCFKFQHDAMIKSGSDHSRSMSAAIKADTLEAVFQRLSGDIHALKYLEKDIG